MHVDVNSNWKTRIDYNTLLYMENNIQQNIETVQNNIIIEKEQ